MSRVSLQDSINPKPLSEGIAEEHPRQPEDWLVDYLETVKLIGGTRATAMQSIQIHLSGAARSWIKKLPPGSIDSWESFEDVFIKNFRSTCKKPATLEELRVDGVAKHRTSGFIENLDYELRRVQKVRRSWSRVILISPEGDKLKYVLRMTFPNASNNEAEYEALIHGMKMAKACGATRLKIFGDSQLVAQQVMNQCDAVNDSMVAYKEMYNELEKLFDGCEVNHISRLSNDEADVLANIGSQCLAIPPGVFWEEIIERSTKPKKSTKKEKNEKPSGAAKETLEEEEEEEQDLVLMVQIPWMQIMATPTINFNSFIEKEKLNNNGSNFADWFRNLRIVLTAGQLLYVLEAPLGDPPIETTTDEAKAVYLTRKTQYSTVQCPILYGLESELQKRFENHDPHDIISELKMIFETHAAVESYDASEKFFNCKMEEGGSVSEHVLMMSGHAKKLQDLGITIPNALGIHRALQSLPPSYKNFVMNYNMQCMNKTLPELFSMLKTAEVEIKKEHQVLMVNKTTKFKKQGKSKEKGKFWKGGKKADAPPKKPKTGPKPDTVCYYCKQEGHWKRNCSKYLADLKSGNIKKKRISDIHELRNKRRLARDEVTMRVGNGSKVDVIAVGALPLHLTSGLVLNLNNYYLVPALSMNIISGSCLLQSGYSLKSENNGCSIYMNNIFYGRAPKINDDLSRYGYIYLMKHKSETFEKFKEFQSEEENQRNKKIKFLRSDRGGEYLSYEFGMYLKKCGIPSQLTPHGTSQRNGVSERRNRTLLDMTAAFTLNRAPSKSVEMTPYELWFGNKPKLSFLKVWGYEAYVKKLQPDKLEPKAEKFVFIGYPKETIGYTFYHKSEGKIFVAKNGSFLEKEFLSRESSATPEDVLVPPTPISEEANDNDHETSNELTTEPRRSTRVHTTPDWYDSCLNVMIVDNNDEDPATYEEAMMSPDSNKWQEAMKSEMGSMYDNQMDVKTAFLNGDIEEELYMVQPKGFVDHKNADKVETASFIVIWLETENASCELHPRPPPPPSRRSPFKLRCPANSRRAAAGLRCAEIFGSNFFASAAFVLLRELLRSPSTVLAGGCRPASPPANSFPSDRAAQGQGDPKPKPPVQCGSCIVGSRQGSTFLKLTGLESCRTWQGTFFYVKNTGRADRINLPPYQAGPPSRTNWSYNPRTEHAETNRVVRFLASLKKETNICSDDIIRTFISRRVLPLKRRAHRMSEMYGPGDPTKITGRALSKKDVVLARQICQTAMPFAWEWGLLPLSFSNRPTQEARDRFPSIQAEPRGPLRKRAFDSFDPDPYIFWKDLKMGKTPAARLGRDPPEPTGNRSWLCSRSTSACRPCAPRPALSLWTNSWPRARRTSSRHLPLGSSLQALPDGARGGERSGRAPLRAQSDANRFRPRSQAWPEAIGLEGSARISTPPPCKPAPSGAVNISPPFGGTTARGVRPPSSDHRTEEDLPSSRNTKTPAPATSAPEKKKLPARSLLLLPSLKRQRANLPRRKGSKTGDAPSAPPSPRTILMPPPEAPRAQPSKAAPGAPPAKTSGASSTAPPPKPSKLIKGKATASSAPSGGQQPLVLHVSKAAAPA
ncbi:hypothetical protein QYE76_063963 [Lolium multiflorum]|uniref:Uncharacterized protein n=1 Tax=Lolium multiflorum TaxID=4521 RepID=A0AAD8W7J0_LOLMU|nr:hypothetical protein QYE76_063963 [Lolium multiflorum]